MTKDEKIYLLKNKLRELKSYQSKLNEESLDEFDKLKEEIVALLDEDQLLRFNQIEFYEVVENNSSQSSSVFDDDLPF